MSLGLGMGLGMGQNVAASGGGGGVAAATWATTSGADKYSGLTLTNSNLTAAQTTGTDVFMSLRASRVVSQTGAFEFEVTYSKGGSGQLRYAVGIEDGTDNFSTTGVVPGETDSHGVAILAFDTSFFVSRNGVHSQTIAVTPADGDRITVRGDKGAGTLSFYRNGTQLGTTETGIAFATWSAYASLRTGFVGSTLTANFAGPFVTGTDPAY